MAWTGRLGNGILNHPYSAVDAHEPLPRGLGPKPLLRFLARVEDLLLEHDLL